MLELGALGKSFGGLKVLEGIDLVVPELQRRGAYKEAYAPGTLRQKLFGHDRLGTAHPAARERW